MTCKMSWMKIGMHSDGHDNECNSRMSCRKDQRMPKKAAYTRLRAGSKNGKGNGESR